MDTNLWFSVLGAVLSVAVGALVLWREPRSLASRVFAGGMLAFGAESVLVGLGARSVLPGEMLRYRQLGFVPLALLPGTWLLFSLAYSRGNYAEFVRKWALTLVLFCAVPLLLVFGASGSVAKMFQPETLFVERQFRLGWAGVGVHAVVLVGAVLVIMNLERTLRAAVGTMRWRAKLVVIGLGTLFGVRIYTSSQVLLYRKFDALLESVNQCGLVIACVLIGLSVVRTRVFGIEVYPSRALLHRSLTVLLAGLYLLVVGIVARWADVLGISSELPAGALLILVALAFLALALMSDRVRTYTARFVSQHLRRPHYDYRQVWRTFSERTATRVRLGEFCEAVARWIAENLNVLSVTVWLVEPSGRRLVFGASTALSDETAERLLRGQPDASAMIGRLTRCTEPINVETSDGEWEQELSRLIPDHFGKGGGRLVQPLAVNGELLGLLTLGDRVSGIPFSVEDMELLRSIGDQVANGLLNLELSRRLAELRELEAFQTMSAFFVHDLKNVASGLSLMLENLPAHFEKPEFREDALRVAGQSVSRINALIGMLSELRRGMELERVETDVGELVRGACRSIESTRGIKIAVDLGPLPKVSIDPEQMAKVVTNLLLNAIDAVGPEGQVSVSTRTEPPWAVVTVLDNGCGMKPEFIRHQLFRPFQTTKKRGLGIGLYHSKMIVEAHGGKIEVESEVGKGTVFRVLIPLLAGQWRSRVDGSRTGRVGGLEG
jgi:hypothetical protein